jgi:histone-lysine N-methyltransferase SETD3
MSVLADWIRDNGGTVHVELADEEGEGRAAIATRDIEHGARLLAVPRTLLLTPAVVRDSAMGAALSACGPALDAQSMLAAYLLLSLRESTPWTPYADALPTAHPDVPVTYDDTDLAHLAGSSMFGRVQRERRLFREQFGAITAAVPQLAPCDFDEFLWARVLVPSRAFALLGSEALVPMADMLNHRRIPDVEWGYEHPTECFVLRAVHPIAAGELVHDSYGKKSNALLLELYGFCLDDVDRDEALLGLPQIDPRHPLAAGTSTFGRTVDEKRTFRVAVSAAQAEESAAVTYLRRMLGDSAPLDADDARLKRTMADACDLALAAFSTTLEQDETLLASGELTARVRRGVRVRAGEKRALAAVRARYT